MRVAILLSGSVVIVLGYMLLRNHVLGTALVNLKGQGTSSSPPVNGIASYETGTARRHLAEGFSPQTISTYSDCPIKRKWLSRSEGRRKCWVITAKSACRATFGLCHSRSWFLAFCDFTNCFLVL